MVFVVGRVYEPVVDQAGYSSTTSFYLNFISRENSLLNEPQRVKKILIQSN